MRLSGRQPRSFSSLGLLAKLDLHNAYRMVPVHPDDHGLLGVCWGEEVFIDTALPFGLRSAPKIFSAMSDALAWILQARGVTHQLHYLDDFLLLGPPGTSTCARALQCTLDTCQQLGVPVATHKTEGPSYPGHPDRHQQNGTEPPPRQAGTHLSNSVRVEGQEGRDEKAAAVPHRYPQPCSHGSHSWPGFPEAHD